MTRKGSAMMISDEGFFKLLTDKTQYLSEGELTDILDSELKKPDSEMNTQIIEACLEELKNISEAKQPSLTEKNKTNNGLPRKRTAKRFILSAALAAVLVICTMLSTSLYYKATEPAGERQPFNMNRLFASENSYGYILMSGSALINELSDKALRPSHFLSFWYRTAAG